MLIAEEYLGSVGVGVTSPQFFRANDDNTYVVKLQNNKLGSKVLVNEFLGSHFGELWGLSFPHSSMIQINEHTLHQDDRLAALGITAGRHFASRYLENTEYVGRPNLYKAVNIKEMAGVMLFDHLFHNADRANNRRNLLLQRNGDEYKIYAIDNSHLFRSGRWTLETLNRLTTYARAYYQYSYGVLLKNLLTPQDFAPYLAMAAQISAEQIDNLVQSIPQEWLPDETERQELASHIKIRLSMAEEIWQNLCVQIPLERGGKNWWHKRVIGSKVQCEKVQEATVFSSKRIKIGQA